VEVFVDAARRALDATLSPTHERVAEALPAGGALLDVGAGAGAASLPVAGRASRLIAVDQDRSMLDALAEMAQMAAKRAGLRLELATGEVAADELAAGAGQSTLVPTRASTGRGSGLPPASKAREGAHLRLELVTGRWPDVATEVGTVDVAVAANVAYNVADLGKFVEKLTGAARRRAVLELTSLHPLAPLSPLWEHFWGLHRPDGPTAEDAAAVVKEVSGLTPGLERWKRGNWTLSSGGPGWVRRRLCLPAEREPEVAEALADLAPEPAEMVTLWWPKG
jgi:hypothetical protein